MKATGTGVRAEETPGARKNTRHKGSRRFIICEDII